jgi:hypothetical protein
MTSIQLVFPALAASLSKALANPGFVSASAALATAAHGLLIIMEAVS